MYVLLLSHTLDKKEREPLQTMQNTTKGFGTNKLILNTIIWTMFYGGSYEL
jgi:hypothetical protein